MSIEGQGHFFTIYFPGFVCFVLYYAKISGERLQDHWSSGFLLELGRSESRKRLVYLIILHSYYIYVYTRFIQKVPGLSGYLKKLKSFHPDISFAHFTSQF